MQDCFSSRALFYLDGINDVIEPEFGSIAVGVQLNSSYFNSMLKMSIRWSQSNVRFSRSKDRRFNPG